MIGRRSPRLSAWRLAAPAVLAAALLGACDDGEEATTVADDTSTTSTSSTSSTTTTTTAPQGLGQPVIWPAPSVVFDTPEAAAADFVREVLDVDPVLGDFQQGDSRSGEIVVFSPGEGGGQRIERGRLLLRRLGPDDGWYVIAAANENASITSPEANATVPAGPVTVEGQARGFEGNVVVTAFLAGNDEAVLDQEITQGGAFAEPEPYSVTLDLAGAAPGDTVALLVRGGTGLESDPGEFGAIPVVIAG